MGKKSKNKSGMNEEDTTTHLDANKEEAKSGRSKRQKEANKSDGNGTSTNAATSSRNSSSDGDNQRASFTGLIQKLTSSMGNANLDDMTTRDIFKRHPMIRVGKFVFIPYLLYYAYYYIRLQHPEYMTKATGGIINLRPAVYGTNTSRQVLIVATPGSGTVQMTNELQKKLSLEIGHETTDAAWDFTRDGSISWFHGIRFLSEPKEANDKVKAIGKICNHADFEIHSNMGFHPAMFGPPINKCSYRSKWDECWKSECYISLLKEWGCAITDTCEKTTVTFPKNIHQVRNPMHTLESLVVKYCIGGVDGLAAVPFWTYASALFPKYDNFYADSCIEAVGYFMVMYLEAMVDARKKGELMHFIELKIHRPVMLPRWQV